MLFDKPFIVCHVVLIDEDPSGGGIMKYMMMRGGLCLAMLCASALNAQIFSSGFEDGEVSPAPTTVPQSLFISGHSLTDNPLANDIEHIAQQKGHTLAWDQQIGLGSPVRVRTSGGVMPSDASNTWAGYRTGKNRNGFDMDVISELRNPTTLGAVTRYDALLITERHDILETIRWELSEPLLRHYHEQARAGHADIQTYYYQSWLGIRNMNDPSIWLQHEQNVMPVWQCVANKVNQSLALDGLPENIKVIPAGWGLTRVVEAMLAGNLPGYDSGSTNARLDAFFSDNVHLNRDGVFYVAALSYAIMFGESPVGVSLPPDVSSNAGPVLAQMAWEHAQEYQANHSAWPTAAQCNQVLNDSVCESHYFLVQDPSKVEGCRQWSRGESWDGPTFKPADAAFQMMWKGWPATSP